MFSSESALSRGRWGKRRTGNTTTSGFRPSLPPLTASAIISLACARFAALSVPSPAAASWIIARRKFCPEAGVGAVAIARVSLGLVGERGERNEDSRMALAVERKSMPRSWRRRRGCGAESRKPTAAITPLARPARFLQHYAFVGSGIVGETACTKN